MQRRSSGILLPVSALPGPYGIGTLGESARRLIDFLAQAGQRYWQILPLVPPGGGDSPYMSPSSFAGNPLFLDLEALAQEGLLTRAELACARYPGSPDRADYACSTTAARPCCGRRGTGPERGMPPLFRIF